MDTKIFYFALFLTTTSLDIRPLGSECDTMTEWDVITKKCRPTGGQYGALQSISMKKSCKNGFRFDEKSSECVDIDECNQRNGPCKASEYCVNVVGGYKCKLMNLCGQGYQVNVTTHECEDMDECENGMDNCGSKMVCHNVPGSFICRAPCPSEKKYYWNGGCNLCPEGFRFNRTTRQCFDFDECEDPFKMMCKQYKEKCVRMPGLSRCVISCSGRTKMENGICYDIDECSMKLHNCSLDTKCVNLFGTFQCEPPNCETNEIFNADKNVCECRPGYQMNLYSGECADTDECAVEPKPCGIHGQCINVVGNYTCVCEEGYRLQSNVCVDIDECAVFRGICGYLGCKNKPGSYECVCPDGLRLNQYDICEDIDECRDSSQKCNVSHLGLGEEYRCINLFGSFKCVLSQCPMEYHTLFDGHNGRQCELRNANCSLERSSECIQMLPQYIFTDVIEIPRTKVVPLKIVDILHGVSEFNHYQIEMIVRKSIYTRTKEKIDLENLLILTYDEDLGKLSLFLTQSLRGPSEIECELVIKYNLDSETRVHSLFQYHIFVNDGVQ